MKIELTNDQIQNAIQNAIEHELESKYSSNPIRSAVSKAISDHSDEIDALVKEVLTNSIKDPKFKERLADVALSKIIERGLK